MSDKNMLARIIAEQAARAARSGKSMYSSKATNALAGWKLGGPLAPQVQGQQPQAATPPSRKSSPESELQARLLARIKTVDDTGFAVPGDGMLPGVALRPEVAELFKGSGGVSAIDMTNLSPEETEGMRRLIDPNWAQRRK